MKINDLGTNPFYQMEYDEQYETHENNKDHELAEVELLNFQDWYDQKQLRHSEISIKYHLLQESYRKTLHYSIYCLSIGNELTESQKILHCIELFGQFLTTYR